MAFLSVNPATGEEIFRAAGHDAAQVEAMLEEASLAAPDWRDQPIEFVSAAAPRTLLVHGTDDTRVLPEHSRRLAEQLEAEGVPVTLHMYDGTGHVRVVAALAPPLQFIADTLDDVVAFIRGD